MAARRKVVPLRARAAAAAPPPSPHDLAEDLYLEIGGAKALLHAVADWCDDLDADLQECLFQIVRNLDRALGQAGALEVMLQGPRAQKGGA